MDVDNASDRRHQNFSQLIDNDLRDANSSVMVDAADLHSISHHIGVPFPCDVLLDCAEKTNIISECIICNTVDLRQRINLIKSHMGSMAQCRGARGESLREAGAIDSLLSIAWRLISSSNDENYSITLPSTSSNAGGNAFAVCCERHSHFRDDNFDFDTIAMEEIHSTAIDLAIASLGSLRDLACGSALNRAAFLSWKPPPSQSFNGIIIENGVHVLVAYIKRYDGLSWQDILGLENSSPQLEDASGESVYYTARGRKEIRLLTNALGAIRNSSHSTVDVCRAFYMYGVVDLLMWRLVANTSTETHDVLVLPDASKPWREACYRIAGSLINLAEKCPDVAMKLASNRKIIYILLETWGGTNAITFNNEKNNKSLRGLPLLHLGLAAVLKAAAGEGVLEGGLDNVMIQVLEKEKERKTVAQRGEEERKLRMKKAT